MTAIVKYFGQNRISQQFLLSKKSSGTNKCWMKSVTEKGRFLMGFEQVTFGTRVPHTTTESL